MIPMQVKISPIISYKRLTPFMFFALFPGYVIYHLLISYQLISPFLRGYFGIMTAVVAFVYVLKISSVLNISVKQNSLIALINILLFINALAITLIAILNNSLNILLAVEQSFIMLISWICFFSLGIYMMRSDLPKLIQINIWFFISFLFFVVYYVISTKSVMLSLADISGVDESKVSGYQLIAQNISIIGYLLLCFAKNSKKLFMIILSFTFVLFFVGARSDFAIFIVCSLLLTLLKSRFNLKYFLSIILAIGVSTFVFFNYKDNLGDSRQLQLLNISDASSWQARESLRLEGIQAIKNNPIFGSFGAHVKDGDAGAYIHNILSAWENYGLLFFVFFMINSLYITISSFKKYMKTNSQKWSYVFIFNFSCLAIVCISQPIFWAIPFMAWGIYIGAKSTD